MYKSLKILGAAALFAAAASTANAAPVSAGQISDGLTSGVSNGIVDVQGYRGRWDRNCRRGPGGWYRTNRRGERRSCRRWDGRGRRPDACVKFGPIWYCD